MDSSINKNIGIKDLIKQNDYLKLLIATIISRFGDSIDAIAFTFMVYNLTGSTLIMGTLFAVNAIPGVIFSPFCGVLVDRMKKRTVIISGDVGRGLIVTLTAYLFFINKLEPWHLFVFTFINSTFETFVKPSKLALAPLILPKELFLSANSFSTSLSSMAELMGLGVAGFIIALTGYSGALFVDAFTFFLSAFFISLVKIKEVMSDEKEYKIKSYLNDLKEGIIFVKKQKVIMITILLFGFVNFCLSPINALMAAYVKDVLLAGPKSLSIVQIGFPIGIILGGLLMSQFGSKFKKGYLIVFAMFIIGLSYSAFSLPGIITFNYISPTIFASSMFFMMGLCIPVATAPLSTYILSETPKELLGRVASLMGMVTLSAIPLGGFITGIVSEFVSIPILFLVMGSIMSILSFFPLLNKDFRTS